MIKLLNILKTQRAGAEEVQDHITGLPTQSYNSIFIYCPIL